MVDSQEEQFVNDKTVRTWACLAAMVSWVLCGCGGPDESDPFGMPMTGASAGDDLGSDGDDADADDDEDEDEGEGDATGDDDSADDADADDAADDAGTGDDSGGLDIPEAPFGLCAEAVPASAPTPPAPPAYTGGVCPALSPGYVTNFLSGGNQREFALVVPSNYDPQYSYPLAIGWYHLSGNAMDFLDTIGGQTLADATQTIYVVPQDSGNFEFVWPSTPLDNGQANIDLTFFDDLLACVSEQYSVNPYCVGSVGVSAGGLWTSFLGQKRGQYLSSNVVISGGHPPDIGWWGWSSSPHKFASLVIWGGPSDELIINFHQASTNLIGEYKGDNHFVVQCEHTGGHGVPPPDMAGNPPPFDALFEFFLAHPYWFENGNSPYITDGLPADFPTYCSM